MLGSSHSTVYCNHCRGQQKKLVDAGALDVLVGVLKRDEEDIPESTHRSSAVALCDLIQSHDDRKIHILEIGVLDPLKRILTSETIRNNELKYWSLMVLHQVSLSGMNGV